jgi:hypothetical protein
VSLFAKARICGCFSAVRLDRRRILTKLMVAAAGVASANLLTTAPQGAPPASPGAQPAPRAAATVAGARAEAAVKPLQAASPRAAPAPTAQKVSVGMRQPPVPLLMKPRTPVNLPAVDGKAGDAKPAAADQAASDGFNESAAKAAIEADGYKGVKLLRKGANGVWHASALRGKTTVRLTVDANGAVTAE